MESFVLGLGEKSFRGRQLFSWIYGKNAATFEEMSDIRKPLRSKLARVASIGHLHLVDVKFSRHSLTRKYLFRLRDGETIESVLIPEGKRCTLCLSSQVGCARGCLFCATGSMGLVRQLSAGEIVDQLLCVQRESGEKVTNVVFMGMGEPFDNYDQVIRAAALINHSDGIAIGHRRIVISTAGVVPAIKRYAEEQQPYRLAVSLNAATDGVRSRLMPIARRWSLEQTFAAILFYARRCRRRPTFEYVLIEGINDSPEQALELRRRLAAIPNKLNLIPCNSVDPAFRRPSPESMARFIEQLKPLHAPLTVRWSKGEDIRSACGQLSAGYPVTGLKQ